MQCLSAIEEDYLNAKAQITDTSQDNLQATVAFISARAALQQVLEELWPSSDETCKCSIESGYDKVAYGQYNTR